MAAEAWTAEMADDEPPFDLFEPSADDSQPSWSTIPLPNNIHIELQTSVAAVWGSSLNLAAFLCSHAEMFESNPVIELGAGAGLPALVAASLGASSVLGTDLDHHSVDYMLRAIEHNKLAATMTASRLDWADAAAIDATTPCPVLLAADCNYYTSAVTPLLNTIDKLLCMPGILLLASREQRHGLEDCLIRLRTEVGLRLERTYTFGEEDGVTTWTEDDSGTTGTEEARHRLWIFRREEAPIYFESQRLMRCGCHALNNLLGEGAFSPADLDSIALTLANGGRALQHRWPVVGNYDVNVVLSCCASRGLEATWWDARKPDAELLDALADENVVGVLLNVRSYPGWLFGKLAFGRHWAALRKMPATGGGWMDVDSNLSKPEPIRWETALVKRLRSVMSEQGYVFVVRRMST